MHFAGHYHHLLQLIPVFAWHSNLNRTQPAGGGCRSAGSEWRVADAGYGRRAVGGGRRAATRVSGTGVGRPVGAGVWLVQAVGWRGRLVGSGGREVGVGGRLVRAGGWCGRLMRTAGWCGRLVGSGGWLVRAAG